MYREKYLFQTLMAQESVLPSQFSRSVR